MQNLTETFRDSHSRSVLNALKHEIEQHEKHPLLQRLRSTDLSIPTFVYISKSRLSAALHFTDFLSAVEEKARASDGYQHIAAAMRENLDEELGLKDGVYVPGTSHEDWRQQYENGLERIRKGACNKKLEGDDTINASQSIHIIQTEYSQKLLQMTKEESIGSLAGAFAVLEGVLSKEFQAMHVYIRTKLTSLTQDETLYIAHHAGHEDRHMAEVAIPLLKLCAQSPHIVSNAVQGIKRMSTLRREKVLDTIQNGLSRM